MKAITTCALAVGAYSSRGLTTLTGAFREACVGLVSVEEHLSPRVRMNFKNLPGARYQHGAEAWSVVMEVQAASVKYAGPVAAKQRKYVEDLAEALKERRIRGPREPPR